MIQPLNLSSPDKLIDKKINAASPRDESYVVTTIGISE
jgi:hypothetical protein